MSRNEGVARRVLRALVRPGLALLPRRARDWLHLRKHRLNWLGRRGDEHERYFAEYRTRAGMVGEIRDWLAGRGLRQASIFEFGCSGGNVLRLMREMIAMPITYCGMDLREDAVAFARGQFPDARFLVGDERRLRELLPSLGRFDLFLASGVLSYLPEARCREVLAAAARVADALLVCDDLGRFGEETGGESGIFVHPWARLCREAGWRVLRGPIALSEEGLYSIFVAVPVAGAVVPAVRTSGDCPQ